MLRVRELLRAPPSADAPVLGSEPEPEPETP
jgi:hypothetical protein